MDASLDTNVIIHLYNADFQELLFNRFEKLKVKSEKEWMKSFCAEKGINAKIRMQKLSDFLQNQFKLT